MYSSFLRGMLLGATIVLVFTLSSYIHNIDKAYWNKVKECKNKGGTYLYNENVCADIHRISVE